MKGNFWAVARCKVCGREIVVRDNWAYKIPNGNTTYYFCTWKHLQKFRAGKVRKTKERGLTRGEKVGR